MWQTPTHILVPMDFSDHAEAAFGYAVGLAAAFNAKLTLLHVTNRRKIEDELLGMDALKYLSRAGFPDENPPSNWEELQTRVQQQLREVGERAATKVSLNYECRDGIPSEQILEYARAQGVNAIVMGTRGRGRTAQFVSGSVTNNVIRQAECAVTTVRAPQE